MAASPASPAAAEEAVLALTLRSERPVIRAGEAWPLEVRLSSREGSGFYVERPPSFGPGGLSVDARKGKCGFYMERALLDIFAPETRFNVFPLTRDRDVVESLSWLNAPEAYLPMLPVDGPGRYHVRATFSSEGAAAVGVLWPVWRGTAASNEIELEIEPARPESIEKWRNHLQRCVSAAEGCAEELSAVRYFQHVRDDAAAELLVRWLQKDPVLNSPAISAIAFQRRAKDVAVLEKLYSNKHFGSGKPQSILEKTIAALKNPTACE
jgi:hypothetical protein